LAFTKPAKDIGKQNNNKQNSHCGCRRNIRHHLKMTADKMKRELIVLVFSILFSTIMFGQNRTTPDNSKLSHTFQIQNIVVKPKIDLELHSFDKISNDTLNLVVCSKFVYYPFGKIENKSALKESSLKIFEINDKTDKQGNVLQVLHFNSSEVILFFDGSSEGPISSYVIKGKIVNDEIVLENNIKIGMSKKEFFNLFFYDFPSKLEETFNEIGLIACVDGTNHYYSFKNDKLILIRFECPSCLLEIK
jgi:hypothetical protein